MVSDLVGLTVACEKDVVLNTNKHDAAINVFCTIFCVRVFIYIC